MQGMNATTRLPSLARSVSATSTSLHLSHPTSILPASRLLSRPLHAPSLQIISSPLQLRLRHLRSCSRQLPAPQRPLTSATASHPPAPPAAPSPPHPRPPPAPPSPPPPLLPSRRARAARHSPSRGRRARPLSQGGCARWPRGSVRRSVVSDSGEGTLFSRARFVVEARRECSCACPSLLARHSCRRLSLFAVGNTMQPCLPVFCTPPLTSLGALAQTPSDALRRPLPPDAPRDLALRPRPLYLTRLASRTSRCALGARRSLTSRFCPAEIDFNTCHVVLSCSSRLYERL